MNGAKKGAEVLLRTVSLDSGMSSPDLRQKVSRSMGPLPAHISMDLFDLSNADIVLAISRLPRWQPGKCSLSASILHKCCSAMSCHETTKASKQLR